MDSNVVTRIAVTSSSRLFLKPLPEILVDTSQRWVHVHVSCKEEGAPNVPLRHALREHGDDPVELRLPLGRECGRGVDAMVDVGFDVSGPERQECRRSRCSNSRGTRCIKMEDRLQLICNTLV